MKGWRYDGEGVGGDKYEGYDDDEDDDDGNVGMRIR